MSTNDTLLGNNIPAQKTTPDSPDDALFYLPAIVKDTDYLAGFVLLIISLGIFRFYGTSPDFSLFGTFMINYVIAIGYTIWLLVRGKMKFFWKRQKKEFRAHRLLLWIIWIVSCFALNKSMSIFNASAPWLSAVIVVSGLTCALFSLAAVLPLLLRKILYFCFGMSTVLWAYYSLYLVWLYPLSIPAIIFFGLSIHTFIPMILLIAHLKILRLKWKVFATSIVCGISFPVILFLYFYFHWYIDTHKIRYASNDIVTNNTSELPKWVMLGQTLGNGWITERLIKGNLVYQTPSPDFSFVPRGTNFQDESQHDPLVLLATLFSPKIDLSEKERIKLLDVLFDARHYTQERLWAGKNLTTDNVVTQAKIFPEYRMAYTEKTIAVANNNKSGRTQQEALYTFYLPEGAVVSSLSLWINDQEEKGYLTTRTKADSAYRTIVGVESRDPSVVHWQEGNTVKVKVFPCTPKENRCFKIGVTSPLKWEANKLIYENIYFQGPSAENATESIKLDFTTVVSHIRAPFAVETAGGKSIVSHGKYLPSWEVSFDSVSLGIGGFLFQGKNYSVQPCHSSVEPFTAKHIYLDINAEWTENEFDEIYHLLKNRNLYVYDNGFVKITASDRIEHFRKLKANRYTIFPVHKLPDAASSLIITKGTPTSPNLKDLEATKFGDGLAARPQGDFSVRVLDFGEVLSPYFKTLKELRIIRCESTNLQNIREIITKGQFPADQESIAPTGSQSLRIGNSGLLIVESNNTSASSAPDHLLRLFAYNQVMKQIGPQYLRKNYLESSDLNASLIETAQKANIVTPVSSLIVLETQADYKRFNIEKSRNSLDNATMKNYGAVPEPHEWLLIGLFALFVSFYIFRSHVR